MTGFNSDFIEELKSKADIVSTISKYLPLTKKGRNFWGRCPFHHEKTASFSVNPEGQYYHCFGCNASGDAIKFVQEMENLDFLGAVTMLSEQNNVKMPEISDFQDKNLAQKKFAKERSVELMKTLANFYYASLQKSPQNLSYFFNRGVSRESIKKFALGFCPDFSSSIEYLKSKGFSKEEMIACGVATEKNGRLYDVLFGRLIFPIVNNFGEVIAFGGRILEKTDFAKYKNTTETILFNKSKTLYGINLIKEYKKERALDSLIIVEGYMDTIALSQAGFGNVVASMGTSLTKEQARYLKRYVEKVYICYDGDSAGQKATIRGLEILQAEGLNVLVISIQDGLDPDELIAQKGVEGFKNCIANAVPLVDFKLMTLRKMYNFENADEKRKYIMNALKVVKEIDSSAEQEDCLKLIRAETGYSLDSLKEDLLKSKDGEIKINTNSAKTDEFTSPQLVANRFLLFYNLTKKIEYDGLQICEKFDSDEVTKKVCEYIYVCIARDKKPVASMLFELIDEQYHNDIYKILQSGDNKTDEEIEVFYEDCKKLLRNFGTEQKIKQLTEEFSKEKDLQKRTKIAQEIKELLAISQKK